MSRREPLLIESGLRGTTRDPADIERERNISALFDRIESACPRLFRGQKAVTEPLGSTGWERGEAALPEQCRP